MQAPQSFQLNQKKFYNFNPQNQYFYLFKSLLNRILYLIQMQEEKTLQMKKKKKRNSSIEEQRIYSNKVFNRHVLI